MASDAFIVVNSFKALFVGILAQWLFSRETHGAIPALMDVVEFLGARVPAYNDDVESQLGLAIRSNDM